MRIKSFTLIELIVVIVILSIVSLLILPKNIISTKITPDKLRDILSPNGVFYLIDKNESILLTNPIVYDKDLNIITFKKYKNKDVLFKYEVRDNIGDSYILKCDEGIYIFKPFYIKEVNSLQEAQKILNQYLPKEGSYYK